MGLIPYPLSLMLNFMKPIPVDRLTEIFAVNVKPLMPDFTTDQARRYRENWHHGESWGFKLFNDMFYKGLTKLRMIPRPGIDPQIASTHIRCIMRSFEPKHEDKVSACAYLFELWFEAAEWEAKPPME